MNITIPVLPATLVRQLQNHPLPPPPSPQPTVSPSTQPSIAPSASPSESPAPKKPVRIIITQFEQPVQTLDPSANLTEAKLNLNFDDKGIANVRFQVDYDYFGKESQVYYVQYKLKQEPAENISPTENQTQEVKVLVLKYFPLDSSGSQLNENTTGMNANLAKIRQYVDNLTQQGLQKLTEGSRYHGYKTNSPAALRYNLLDSKEFLQPIPVSINHVPWNQQAFRPDYKKILNDINICDYVDGKGVNQVWVWSYHTKIIEPAESNMSMGSNSKNFWPQGTYGDISNSEQIDDMPICQKTYTLYNYNYQRGLGEMLEDHGHHIEAVLRFVDYDLFWNKFVAPHGETGGGNNCGWMHAPPNVSDNDQYNWTSKTKVLSACEDWKPLDDGAAVNSVDCSEWGCANDTGASYKVWWMQNLPGMNNGLIYRGNKMRNWWVFIGDFDSAMAAGKSLTAVSNKFSVQSAKTSTPPQSDNNYVPPASLPHPSYPPADISSPIPTVAPTPQPSSTPKPTPTPVTGPLQLIDFNNDGVINIFDYIIFAQKKLGR